MFPIFLHALRWPGHMLLEPPDGIFRNANVHATGCSASNLVHNSHLQKGIASESGGKEWHIGMASHVKRGGTENAEKSQTRSTTLQTEQLGKYVFAGMRHEYASKYS